MRMSSQLCTFWMILMHCLKIHMSSHLSKGSMKTRAATFQIKQFNVPVRRMPTCNLAAAVFIPCLICINGSRDSPVLHSGNISCLPQNRFVLLLTNKEAQEKGRVWDYSGIQLCSPCVNSERKTYWKLFSIWHFRGIPDIPVDQWFWPLY